LLISQLALAFLFASLVNNKHLHNFIYRLEGPQEGLQQGLQQSLQEGRYEIAKSLLAEGLFLDLVKKVTKLPDLDLSELEKA